MYVTITSNELSISITHSRANNHDSIKFIEAMKRILDLVAVIDSLKQIKHCFADK